MSILTNFNTGYMKICHFREISDDAELLMLSILDFFPPRLTTKASPGDRTHVIEVTGLEVIDSNPMTTEAVLNR
jgi:hypothetical protein